MPAAILTSISLLQTALGVIATFKGSPALAKTTGYVTDAVAVVNALTPLVTAWGEGDDITPEDVREALAGKDKALAEFDALIAQKGKQP